MRVDKLMVALLIIFPAIAESAPQAFDCRTTGSSSNGIVSERFQFVIDEALGSATVMDAVIANLHGSPQVAKYSKKQNGQYWLRWRIKKLPVTVRHLGDGLGLPSVKTTTSVFFESWLNPNSNQFRIRAKPGRSTNSTRVTAHVEQNEENAALRLTDAPFHG